MKTILLLVFCFVIASCKREAGHFEGGTEAKEVGLSDAPANQVSSVRFPPPVPVPEEETTSDLASVEAAQQPELVADTARKIIKTGDISFETADVKATRARLIETTKKLKGYLAEESESGYENGRKNYTMNLKVPAGNFEPLLEAISSSARQIDSKNIHINDVTAEFIDTRTRLANKKLLERRYLELLNKAGKISDMITIENKLSEIRGEIESVEGQLLYMKKQVAYSTLSVTFYSRSVAVETGKGFGYQVTRALRQGWDFMLDLVFALISIWPLLIALLAGFFLLRRWRRNRKPAKPAAS